MNIRRNRMLNSSWTLGIACLLPMLAACGESTSAEEGQGTSVESQERAARFEVSRAGLANLNLETSVVAAHTIVGRRSFPGLVGYKQTTRAALVSQLEGVVQSVAVQLGQSVKTGDVVCVIKSRGLAEARSGYLEALHKAEFAETLFRTESELWEKKITSRESFLRAQHENGDAQLALDSSKHGLLALGVSQTSLDALEQESELHMEGEDRVDLSLLSFTSPIDGEIVAVDVSQGEAVGMGQGLLDVADLGFVWVDTQIPVRDLNSMEPGNRVTVRWEAGGQAAEGTIAYLAPEVDPDSQTALARIELANPNGRWRPGLYVDVQAEVNPESVPLAVPTTCLVADPESPSEFLVFVQLQPGRFEARPVVVQRSEDGLSALEGRLKAGDLVVSGDTLFLKAVWMGEGGMEE